MQERADHKDPKCNWQAAQLHMGWLKPPSCCCYWQAPDGAPSCWLVAHLMASVSPSSGSSMLCSPPKPSAAACSGGSPCPCCRPSCACASHPSCCCCRRRRPSGGAARRPLAAGMLQARAMPPGPGAATCDGRVAAACCRQGQRQGMASQLPSYALEAKQTTLQHGSAPHST